MSIDPMRYINKVLAPLIGKTIRLPRSAAGRLTATVKGVDKDNRIQRTINEIHRDFSSLPDPVERGNMTASVLRTRAIVKDRSPFKTELFAALITLLGRDITDPITYGCFLSGAVSDTVFIQMKDQKIRKQVVELATNHIVDQGIREKIVKIATDNG
jgi:hypothetical protein